MDTDHLDELAACFDPVDGRPCTRCDGCREREAYVSRRDWNPQPRDREDDGDDQ